MTENIYPITRSQTEGEYTEYTKKSPHLMEIDVDEIFIREYLSANPISKLKGIEPPTGTVEEFLSSIESTEQVDRSQIYRASTMDRAGDIHISEPDTDLYVEAKGYPNKEAKPWKIADKIENAISTIERAGYDPDPTEVYGIAIPLGSIENVKNKLFVNGILPKPKKKSLETFYNNGSDLNFYLVHQGGFKTVSVKDILF